MQHKGKILDRTLPAMDEFEANAFLDDLAISEDADKAITAGLFRLEAGEPMTYTYTYHEMKLILDGEVTISDDTGQPGRPLPLPRGQHHHVHQFGLRPGVLRRTAQ